MVVLLMEMKTNGVRGKYIIIIPTQYSNANLVQYDWPKASGNGFVVTNRAKGRDTSVKGSS